jgi:hypothetical protein
MPASTKAEWLPKAEAAALLDVAPRTLERHEAKGYIEKRNAPRGPLGRGNEVEYSVADILALKAGKPNVHARPVAEESSMALAPVNGSPATVAPSTALARRNDKDAGPFAGLAAQLAGLAAFAAQYGPPAEGKPWLSLREAIDYSGLPKANLLKRARAGTLRAELVSGESAREVWKFNREALAK